MSPAFCRPSFVAYPLMRVRIVKAPPAYVLEGLDLRPYKLLPGRSRELSRQLAAVLIEWGYAAPVKGKPAKRSQSRATSRRPGKK